MGIRLQIKRALLKETGNLVGQLFERMDSRGLKRPQRKMQREQEIMKKRENQAISKISGRKKHCLED